MKMIDQKECREVQMSILDEIARLCKEHNLKYYLAYGSLIGAVRHKGYIPWDDDIDICMMRDDYEKMIAILRDEQSGKASWLTVLDDTDKNYYHPFAKAIDNRTEVKMDRHKDKIGIWVDIFPIDGLSSSLFMAKMMFVICSALRVVALAMSTDFSSKTLDAWTLFYKRVIFAITSVIGRKRVCRFTEWVFRRFSVKDSKYVGMLFSAYMFNAIFEKSELLPQANYKFEEREYTGFANYDKYLSQQYGDYMKLPPEEKRISHNFECWWK